MSDIFLTIHNAIIADAQNAQMRKAGYNPLYTAGADAKIAIIGQAPGKKAQESMQAWHDKSGDILRAWLGVSEDQFYDPNVIALLPMDFYFPGKGKSGDLPPRKGFADKWHPKLLNEMPDIKLIILIGNYAQKHYLKEAAKKNLTETVRSYKDYLPEYFPLVHPSPLNFRWQVKNPWFELEVVPALRRHIKRLLQ
jgi:uracil-DNA glycosylase